jgi:hypothetical protein
MCLLKSLILVLIFLGIFSRISKPWSFPKDLLVRLHYYLPTRSEDWEDAMSLYDAVSFAVSSSPE